MLIKLGMLRISSRILTQDQKSKGQRRGPNKSRPLDDVRIESHFSVLNINQIFLMSFCSLGAEHLFLSFFIDFLCPYFSRNMTTIFDLQS